MTRHDIPTFPASLSPITATRPTRSSLPTPRLLLPAALVPRSPFSRHRYPVHSFPAPHSYGSERERHTHAASFAPAKPIDVFWKARQNAIALQQKTMNGMRKQNENGTRLMPLRRKDGETKVNNCCCQRETFWYEKIAMLHTFEVIPLIIS